MGAEEHALDRIGPSRTKCRAYTTSVTPKVIDLAADFPLYATTGEYLTMRAVGADAYYVTQPDSSAAGGNAIAPAAFDATTPTQQCHLLPAGEETEFRLFSKDAYLQVATLAGTGSVRLYPSSGDRYGTTR